MSNFFAMSGYGHYVWSAYTITFFVLISIFFISWKFKKKTELELKKLTSKRNDVLERNRDETQT